MSIYRIMFIVVLIQDVIIQLRIHKNYFHSALIGLMSLTQVCMRANQAEQSSKHISKAIDYDIFPKDD